MTECSLPRGCDELKQAKYPPFAGRIAKKRYQAARANAYRHNYAFYPVQALEAILMRLSRQPLDK
jgi:hypothetical protein